MDSSELTTHLKRQFGASVKKYLNFVEAVLGANVPSLAFGTTLKPVFSIRVWWKKEAAIRKSSYHAGVFYGATYQGIFPMAHQVQREGKQPTGTGKIVGIIKATHIN